MKQKTSLIAVLFLFVLLFAIQAGATCSCTTNTNQYFELEIVTASCSCDNVLEKSKDYSIVWVDIDNTTRETDTGTTPSTVSDIFLEYFTIPDDTPDKNGTWHFNLTVKDIYKTTVNFSVINETNNGFLKYSDVSWNDEISLGKDAKLYFRLQDSDDDYIINAKCLISINCPLKRSIENAVEITTSGSGTGRYSFNTNEWKQDIECSLVGKTLQWDVSCWCIPNCTDLSVRGCCMKRSAETYLDKLKYSESTLPIYITADDTPIDFKDNSSGVGVVFFLLFITGGVFILSYLIKKFSVNDILNFTLKNVCIIAGLLLLSLTTTVVTTIADNANLGVSQELFRFLWLINWAIYIAIFIMILRYLIKVLQLWTAKKTMRRMGLHNLE